jgi:hypothetical protein
VKYQQPTFTLPTVNKTMTQTDYEIAVGLRNPDGSLVQPKVVEAKITHYRDYTFFPLTAVKVKASKIPKKLRFRRISADSSIA